MRAELGCALLSFVIGVADAETARIAVEPLEVVHERPEEIATHGRAVSDGAVELDEALADVFAAMQVEHFAAEGWRVVVAGAVFRDVDRFRSVERRDVLGPP